MRLPRSAPNSQWIGAEQDQPPLRRYQPPFWRYQPPFWRRIGRENQLPDYLDVRLPISHPVTMIITAIVPKSLTVAPCQLSSRVSLHVRIKRSMSKLQADLSRMSHCKHSSQAGGCWKKCPRLRFLERFSFSRGDVDRAFRRECKGKEPRQTANCCIESRAVKKRCDHWPFESSRNEPTIANTNRAAESCLRRRSTSSRLRCVTGTSSVSRCFRTTTRGRSVLQRDVR